MANPFHREKLCEGAVAWNAWRQANPSIAPDLVALELSLIDRQISTVHGVPVDLSRARLTRADLGHAMLVGADLSKAVLTEAFLANAKLNGANLGATDLTGAILDGADLDGANMHGAIVRGATLFWASNLTQAQVDSCHGDRTTALPLQVVMPAAWLDLDEGGANGARLDLYAILGVTTQATSADLLHAYRARAKIFHPDRNPEDADAEARFKDLARAIDILRDPVARGRYDRGELDVVGKPTLLGIKRRWRGETLRALALYFLVPFAAGLAATLLVLDLVKSSAPPVGFSEVSQGFSTLETASLQPFRNGDEALPSVPSGPSPTEVTGIGPTEEVIAKSPVDVLADDAVPVDARTSPEPVIVTLGTEEPETGSYASAAPPSSGETAVRSSRRATSVDLGRHFRKVKSFRAAIAVLKQREGKGREPPLVKVVTTSASRWAAGAGKRRAEAGHARSDLPFVAPSCKLTPACRAGLDMCSC